MLFEINYGDLNETAKKRLLEAVCVDGPADMNWDDEIQICPLAYYELNDECVDENRRNRDKARAFKKFWA